MAKITLNMLETIVESTISSIEMRKEMLGYMLCSEEFRRELSEQADESKTKLQSLLKPVAYAVRDDEGWDWEAKWKWFAYNG